MQTTVMYKDGSKRIIKHSNERELMKNKDFAKQLIGWILDTGSVQSIRTTSGEKTIVKWGK